MRSEFVEFGTPVVFGGALFGRDPFPFDQAMQGGVERALLDLEDVVGIDFDGFGDGVAVRGAAQQSTKDEEVESALQELDAFFFFFGRHSRWRVSSS